MRASSRWYDNGSRGVKESEVTFSTAASVQQNGQFYIASLRLTRENQNEKRADMHETESLVVEMDLVEARRVRDALNAQIETLEYYSKNGTWPNINGPRPDHVGKAPRMNQAKVTIETNVEIRVVPNTWVANVAIRYPGSVVGRDIRSEDQNPEQLLDATFKEVKKLLLA